MLVLDGSGSMQESDPSGGTKMAAAREAVRTFVEAAPSESQVGLTVYGAGTGNSKAEKRAGCRDVKVLQPVEKIDKPALHGAVDRVKPSGYTPIGASLRKAASALPDGGPRSIVLVSDGEDTCAPPDPCKVAKKLNKQGTDLVVHTVGFGVDGTSRRQLSCIAKHTGGTYSDAPDGDALRRLLPRVSATALRTYEPAGAPITGTDSWRDAPVATPGQYLDTIGQKETRHYAIDVPADATVYFSGTLSFPLRKDIPETEDINGMSLKLYGKDGVDCHTYKSAQSVLSSDGVSLTIADKWGGAAEGDKYDEGSDMDKCRGAGRYTFAVRWSRPSKGVPERLPIELLFGIEPKATDEGPDPADEPIEFQEPGGPAKRVSGGGSFNVASNLDGSGTYTDTLQRGEFVFYRVKLGWGQGLAYRARFGKSGENLSFISTTLYNPIREELVDDGTPYSGDPYVVEGGAGDRLATAPVRYRNRESDEIKFRNQSVPGWYYIAARVSPARYDEKPAGPVDVTLELTVDGQAEEGPTYAPPVDNGGIFDGGGAEGQPEGDGQPDGGVEAKRAAGGDSVAPVGAIVGGGALLAVVTAAAITFPLIRRRRRLALPYPPLGLHQPGGRLQPPASIPSSSPPQMGQRPPGQNPPV